MTNSILRYPIGLFVRLLPETRFFGLKSFLYRTAGYKIGKNTRICSSARLFGSGSIEIGDNVWIGPEVIIISSSLVRIENNVDVAPKVFIGTGTHKIGDIKGRMAGTGINKDVVIKKGSWLGANSLIMPGIVVEEMNIVNAGAIITKNFKPYNLLAGVPAKVIKDLREKNVE